MPWVRIELTTSRLLSVVIMRLTRYRLRYQGTAAIDYTISLSRECSGTLMDQRAGGRWFKPGSS